MRSMKEIMRDSCVLNADGVHVNGSDRESNHRYGDAYESLFPDRVTVKLMMEVGVADGSSMLAWREIFPNAVIVGLDIHHSDKSHGERIEFYRGDQGNQDDCERAAAGRQFDFIVDDASHELVATLRTLRWLWPFVRAGGIYVVEECPDSEVIRAGEGLGVVELVDTVSPFGGNEPLVVIRKPL